MSDVVMYLAYVCGKRVWLQSAPYPETPIFNCNLVQLWDGGGGYGTGSERSLGRKLLICNDVYVLAALAYAEFG
jgi:hypothetical protein